ncbi:hypothetical protein THIOKS1810010 [Thiocapsa sp. KS1]|nr:hypothetical protein THIOKS1810010 [Thiocapsa sp. KS1]
MTLDELIDRLQAKQIIPPHVAMALRTLQSHDSSAQSPEAALIELPGEWGAPRLYALAYVTNWYFTEHAGPVPPLIGGRYLDLGDGTVMDTETNLQWMRCALGQRWDGSTCAGEADKLKWDEMFAQIDVFNKQGGFAGHRDWRAPTINKLKTLIIEGREPCLNKVAFPNIPEFPWFWSSSPGAGNSYSAWYVGFSDGDVNHGGYKNRQLYVRLVRGGR